MGAGVQRWWRTPADRDSERGVWRMCQTARLSTLIRKAPPKEMPAVRRVVTAWAALLTTIKELEHG